MHLNPWTGKAAFQAAKRGDLSGGDPQVGEPSERAVSVDAVAICPSCRAKYDCDVLVRDGRIAKVERSQGLHDYLHGEEFYVILEW